MNKTIAFIRTVYLVVRGLLEDPLIRRLVIWMLVKKVPSLDTLLSLPVPKRLKDASCMSAEVAMAECRRLHLEGPVGMYELPLAVVSKNWNGMGPDSWSEKLRAVVDRLGRVVLLCSLPHDMWYALFCDGTLTTWKITMDQWKRNSEKCVTDANLKADWLNRRLNDFAAETVIIALEGGAYQAWLSCYNTQQNQKRAGIHGAYARPVLT